MLVQLGQQSEQQRAARRAERQVAQPIEDRHVGVHQAVRNLRTLLAVFSISSALTGWTVEKKKRPVRISANVTGRFGNVTGLSGRY